MLSLALPATCVVHSIPVAITTFSMESMNSSNYPLRNILEPHAHDVLCGRGGGTNNHIGNSHWRLLVAANKQLYVTLPKRQKMLLSRSIVNAVRSQNPPGRFLEKNSKTNQWYDVGDHRAQEKTSQALREGAPDLKKKNSGGKLDDESTKQSDVTDSTTSSSTSQVPTVSPVSPKQTPSHAFSPQFSGSVSTETGFPTGLTNMPQLPGIPQLFAPPSQMMQMQMLAHMNQQQQQQQQQEGVLLYAGPNMQPVRLYPTMVMNEHGMMVPGMSMMPAGIMTTMQAPIASSDATYSTLSQLSRSGFTDQGSSTHSTGTNPVPYETRRANKQHSTGSDVQHTNTTTFDEYLSSAPAEGFQGADMSVNSGFLTDVEIMKLQANGTFGSIMSYKEDKDTRTDRDVAETQAPTSLEPTGISFGDFSMMSVGTNRLEAGGMSFGTMMSTGTNLPDGGLEAIGTSFGSLSLEPWNRERLFQALEVTGGGPEIPPMFHVEEKATGNLLDCSDTESEGSVDKPDLGAHKSEAWEKMQASVAQTQLLHAQSNEVMPPPVNVQSANQMVGVTLSLPSKNLERDFSSLSAWNDLFHDRDDEGPTESQRK